VQQVPAHEVEIPALFGFVDGQGKIAAAFGRAVIAQTLAGRHIRAAHSLLRHRTYSSKAVLRAHYSELELSSLSWQPNRDNS
jgi:hypothetical protein